MRAQPAGRRDQPPARGVFVSTTYQMKTRKFSRFVSLREANTTPAVEDPNGGHVYKGVTIIKGGLGNRRDRNFYPAPVL